MKLYKLSYVILCIALLSACSGNQNATTEDQSEVTATTSGQESVNDDVSQKDIVKVAVGSKDHTTLVAALKQAEYVNDLSNAGPFTVFAPTNAAFNALPEGTVDELMKDAKKSDLQNILEHHVALGVYKVESFTDGQTLGMANGDNIRFSKKNGVVSINDKISIIASVRASNGIVHIIDGVLLPPAK